MERKWEIFWAHTVSVISAAISQASLQALHSAHLCTGTIPALRMFCIVCNIHMLCFCKAEHNWTFHSLVFSFFSKGPWLDIFLTIIVGKISI